MKRIFLILGLVFISISFMATDGCDDAQPTSASGVKKAEVQVQVGADGFTAEQRNVRNRLMEDNKPGAVKHLYVISPYSGQVILYSTVKGKVTSGGKRLTPTSVVTSCTENSTRCSGFTVPIGGYSQVTQEVLQDDGTYGSSGDYLYWWDVRGAYHQHYLTGAKS
jgi:hypothetical protein